MSDDTITTAMNDDFVEETVTEELNVPEDEVNQEVEEITNETEENVSVKPVKPAKKPVNKRKTVSIIGIVCGAVILLMGIIAFSGGLITTSGTGSTDTFFTTYEWYGGDAYTGMQQAAADASNNAGIAVQSIHNTNVILSNFVETMCKLGGFILIAMGLMTICISLLKLTECTKEEKKDKTLQEA